MAALLDLYCAGCGATRRDQLVRDRRFPRCGCGARLRADWSRGRAPAIDVYGSERTARIHLDACGRPLTYSSRREYERKMRRQGFEPAGDRVHGARDGRVGERELAAPPRSRGLVEIGTP